METPEQTEKSTFSGRQRRRKTTFAVKASNVIARGVITLGGLSTIAAVTLVCVFLVAVVIPMFLPPSVTPIDFAAGEISPYGNPLHLEVNEYQTMAWVASKEGRVTIVDLETGKVLSTMRPFEERKPSAWVFSGRDGDFVAGFEDGSVQIGSLSFATRFIEDEDVPAEINAAVAEGPAVFRDGVLELTLEGQYRLQSLSLSLETVTELEPGSAIRLLDLSFKNSGPVVAAYTASGTLHLAEVSQSRNLMTGKVTVKLFGGSLPVKQQVDDSQPFWLGLAGQGDNILLAWRDGELQRFDTRQADDMSLAETLDVVPEAGVELTRAGFLIGKTSLVTGDAKGRLGVWFRIKPDGAETIDGALLVKGHELPPADAAITAIIASARSRMLVAGDADGKVHLYYAPTNNRIATLPGETGHGISAVTMAPKDDAIYAIDKSGLGGWKMNVPHPEVSVGAIFGKIWYEGYTEPEHVWQSSSGTDDFEPKYGLMPLIFGTIKATIYAMVFAVPLALLAAVYTSEIMQPKLRARIKPTIEMMASLPSVVLGFLAALVIAPVAEEVVPAILSSFIMIPMILLLGAFLWQLMPHELLTPLRRYRLVAIGIVMAIGAVLALWTGPLVESLLFAGDIKLWLANQPGSGAGGWLIIVLPATALIFALAYNRWLQAPWRRITSTWSRQKFTLVELFRYLASAAVVIAVAALIGWVMAAVLGWDPRGSIMGTYVQRNALIVGFVMGFAVIPIIYTLSEDALSSVPEALRAAALGAGATPWQTAMRIIVPTAASGIFSAVMIGLGRAVGETMIVLMAAGNTPVMEWNMFNGFRTLSANIAVELPEAVKDSTHYRMLFLAALTLFAMTFFLNTGAELIRQRVRKRAYQL